MERKRKTPLWVGLLALTTLAMFHPAARAGCDGCSNASLFPSLLGHGCSGCHYKPANCPTLCSPGTFGYYSTVWNLWPGPLDPETSYRGVVPTVMPPAENGSANHPKNGEKPDVKRK